MTGLALIRHGRTVWNESGRVQGRSDTPLSEAGRADVSRWILPSEVDNFDWMTSPLRRAVETAQLLGVSNAATEPRLAEMHWGDWEGMTLGELRGRYGDEMIQNEARGLDFCAPGGESPREVQFRLSAWLTEISARGRPVAAVTHKGVIRAILALATGWDMTGPPPMRLDWAGCHLFELNSLGRPIVVKTNINLEAS